MTFTNQKSNRKPKRPRQTVNIQFARSLNSKELCALLQEKLVLARGQEPQAAEVSLMTEIVHDIKFRLTHYAHQFGEVDRSIYEDRDDRDYRGDE